MVVLHVDIYTVLVINVEYAHTHAQYRYCLCSLTSLRILNIPDLVMELSISSHIGSARKHPPTRMIMFSEVLEVRMVVNQHSSQFFLVAMDVVAGSCWFLPVLAALQLVIAVCITKGGYSTNIAITTSLMLIWSSLQNKCTLKSY